MGGGGGRGGITCSAQRYEDPLTRLAETLCARLGLLLSGMVVASQILKQFYCIYKPAGNHSAVESPALVTSRCENLAIPLAIKSANKGEGGWGGRHRKCPQNGTEADT